MRQRRPDWSRANDARRIQLRNRQAEDELAARGERPGDGSRAARRFYEEAGNKVPWDQISEDEREHYRRLIKWR